MPGRYYVHTFGCQMNMHDSDRMEEVLRSHGWSTAPQPEEADLIVFNTCSVREKAEQKLRSEVGKLLPLKRRRPELVVAVAGCVAQQEGEALLQSLRLLDLVIGPDNIPELPLLAEQQLAGAPPMTRTVFDLDEPRFLSAQPVPGAAPVSAFVTTMKGCDERCSFCVVPYTRGSERYRPAVDIIEEVQRWVAAGSREVILLGQTVDSYRDPALPPPEHADDPDESQFPELLRRIAQQAPGLVRLRYTSPHPRHATESLARAHAELALLARHVHLPVQSGSDRVLRRMIRRYTRAEYIQRARRLQAARPGLTLSTDIIVGFPGETEDDFQATLTLVEEVGFTSLFGFKYSVRPLTPSRKLRDDISEAEKSERLARLFELSERQGQRHLQAQLGTTQEVLVEGQSKQPTRPGHPAGAPDTARLQGRTSCNEIVHLEVPAGHARALIGQVVQVHIEQALKHSLKGALTEAARARLRADAPLSPSLRGVPVMHRRALPVLS